MNQHISRFLLLIFAGSALVSCHKQNNVAPTITGVKAYLTPPADTTLSLVNPGQYITLEGSGLGATQQVLFDGVAAFYNSALTAGNSLTIQVPDIPFSTVDTSEYNTIEILYAGGKVVYRFPVAPPPPVISAISNEFAHPGDVITLTGQYMYLIQSLTFPGGVAATQFSANTAGTSLTVTVPANATTGGGIVMTTAGGTNTSEPACGFNDPRGMLCNFDDVNNFSWGCSVVDSSTFTGNRGYFGQITSGSVTPGDYSWYNGTRSINTNSVQWINADSLNNPLSDYAMKFEIFVMTPWSAGSLYIVPNYTWTYLADYAPWKTASNSTVGTSSNWQTVVIPLTAFTTNDGTNGTPPANIATFLGSGNQSISIMFVNDGTATVSSYDVGIDNIRVVKVQ